MFGVLACGILLALIGVVVMVTGVGWIQALTPPIVAGAIVALIAAGLATTLAGSAGGWGTTTYGENIGVMAATQVYSTAAYWVAGTVAILLGLSPKVGEVIRTVREGVLGGVTIALYGLIGIIGIKIWIDNHVDFSLPVNQFTAAVALVIGIGDMQFTGIALGTIAAVVVSHVMTTVERLRAR